MLLTIFYRVPPKTGEKSQVAKQVAIVHAHTHTHHSQYVIVRDTYLKTNKQVQNERKNARAHNSKSSQLLRGTHKNAWTFGRWAFRSTFGMACFILIPYHHFLSLSLSFSCNLVCGCFVEAIIAREISSSLKIILETIWIWLHVLCGSSR